MERETEGGENEVKEERRRSIRRRRRVGLKGREKGR